MLEKLPDYTFRRRTPRHDADNCIATIEGKSYPVTNWGEGGALIQADDRAFGLSSPVAVTMKFRLGAKIIDIAQSGRIVRKSRDRVAVQFDPADQNTIRTFNRVVDDLVTREFAESQAA